MKSRRLLMLIAVFAAVSLVTGCGKATPDAETTPATQAHDDHAGHDHAAQDDHDDHTGHDHSGHDHGDHSGHDHGDHDDHAEHAAPAAVSDYGLSLNDGAKWQVDAHTHTAGQALIKLEAGYPTIYTISEAQVLGKGLDTTVNELIKGCTMKGPSHDQLHIFLTALMPQIATLKAARDVETATAARAEVKAILAAYSRHFE